MTGLTRSLLQHRGLLRDFVVRDLKARYVGSAMGFFWSVIFPIVNLAVYMFVFRLVLNARWSDRQGAYEVALIMLAGIVVWASFAETLSRTTNCLVDNANLIKKVVFPAEILPWYLTISSMINMTIGMPVVLGCVAMFAFFMPPKTFINVPGYVENDEWVVDETPLAENHVPYQMRMQLTRGMWRDVIVPLRVSGSATRGEDYLLSVDEAVIRRGDNTVSVVITPLRDEVQEDDESIIIELGPPQGAELYVPAEGDGWAASRWECTLLDAPPAPTLLPDKVQGLIHPQYAAGDNSYHPLTLGLALVALPLLFCLQAFFTVGLGYILSTLNLFLRDTFHLVGVGITVWMFATPIFYPGFMVENQGFGWMLQINPMHWLIECYRSVLLFGLWPDPLMLVRLTLVTAGVFILGGRFFMSHKSKFPDLL
ncbi:MAG: ABC transporter permease [Planctomycetota bacterium]|nr:ABC transporter permease [Planctomycetota bacterium]MDP6938136.1 ABC transporter permease [Planctomycetota bacterium]